MKHYTFVDYATQGYMAVVALLILLFHGDRVGIWPWLLAGHVVGMAVAHALVQLHTRRPANGVISFLRHFYPVIFYVGFYRETGELNHMFTPAYLDPVFVKLEQALFGGQPSVEFMPTLPWWPVSELLYASYFSYYVMIVGVGVALYCRDRRQFFHYVSVVSFVFYVCYLIYIFTPVMGPRVFHRSINGYELPPDVQPETVVEFPAAVQAGWFFRVMGWIYDTFEAPGAAFPSSHVTVAITTAWFSFRYLPRIRHFHLLMVILLCISTVYGRYHYAVDVLAGAMTAGILVPLGNRLYWGLRTATEVEAASADAPKTGVVQTSRS